MGKSRVTQATRRRLTGVASCTPQITFKGGEVLHDKNGDKWKVGKPIGVGGFGVIYTAVNNVGNSAPQNTEYVVKLEPFQSGPLFLERNFYIRVARENKIQEWKEKKKLRFLGVPPFIAFGSKIYQNQKFRFLLLRRYGEDLGKLFVKNKRKFHIKTVLTVAILTLDILEYIHSYGFTHGDIKGSNMLLGTGPNGENEVYLLDYGLACKYVDNYGVHKEKIDLRKAHFGTLEYTSRDAHVGGNSRRGDLEILAYNMVQWLCGSLPWEKETDPEEVAKEKTRAMSNIPLFLKQCFKNDPIPAVIHHFVRYIITLEFDAKPDYSYCKALVRAGLKQAALADDNKLNLHSVPAKLKPNKRVRVDDSDIENMFNLKPVKIPRTTNRQPCADVQENTNRVTRSSMTTGNSVVLRSHEQFDWVKVLQSNPDKIASQKENKKPRTKPPVRTLVSDKDSMCFTIKQKENPRLNPTETMIQQMLSKNKSNIQIANRRNSHNATVVKEQIGSTLTYAMESVIRNRQKRKETEVVTPTRQKRNATRKTSDTSKPFLQVNNCIETKHSRIKSKKTFNYEKLSKNMDTIKVPTKLKKKTSPKIKQEKKNPVLQRSPKMMTRSSYRNNNVGLPIVESDIVSSVKKRTCTKSRAQKCLEDTNNNKKKPGSSPVLIKTTSPKNIVSDVSPTNLIKKLRSGKNSNFFPEVIPQKAATVCRSRRMTICW